MQVYPITQNKNRNLITNFSAGKILITNKEFWPKRHLMAFANNKEYQEIAKSLKPKGQDLRATLSWNQEFGDYAIKLEAISADKQEFLRTDWCANIFSYAQTFPKKSQKLDFLHKSKSGDEQALDLISHFNRSQEKNKKSNLVVKITEFFSKLFK